MRRSPQTLFSSPVTELCREQEGQRTTTFSDTEILKQRTATYNQSPKRHPPTLQRKTEYKLDCPRSGGPTAQLPPPFALFQMKRQCRKF